MAAGVAVVVIAIAIAIVIVTAVAIVVAVAVVIGVAVRKQDRVTWWCDDETGGSQRVPGGVIWWLCAVQRKRVTWW